MSQITVCYTMPAELEAKFRTRLNETGLAAEFGLVPVTTPEEALAGVTEARTDSVRLPEGFVSAETALVCLLETHREVIDDYCERFNEDDCPEEDDFVVADGNPMALSDKDFKTFVDQKLLEMEDLNLWSEALDGGWVLIHGTDGVAEPAVKTAREALRQSIDTLYDIRERVLRLSNLP